MANQPPICGAANIEKSFSSMTGIIEMMRHDISHIDVVSDRIYAAMDLSWIIKGDPDKELLTGKAIAVAFKNAKAERMHRSVITQFSIFTSIRRFTYTLYDRYEIYLDMSHVAAKIAQARNS
jgi:hypothetical protein